MNTEVTVLGPAGGALAVRDLARAAVAGPLACRAAPVVKVGEAVPSLRDFEQQEAVRIEREAERQRQWERQAARVRTE